MKVFPFGLFKRFNGGLSLHCPFPSVSVCSYLKYIIQNEYSIWQVLSISNKILNI